MANRGKISKAGRSQRGSSRRQQSENHTDKLERLLQEAEKRAEEAEVQTQKASGSLIQHILESRLTNPNFKTTLAQYLELVEQRLAAHIRVREPLDLTSLHPGVANVWDDRRLHPHQIREWINFDEAHDEIFDDLIAQEGEQQKFPCRAACQTLVRPLDLRSEAQLSQVAFAYLETPTRAILDQVWAGENCTAEARAAIVHQKDKPTVWVDKCWWLVTGGEFPDRTILISEEKCAHLVTWNDVKSLGYRREEEPSSSTTRLLLQAFTYMVNCGVAYAYAYNGPVCLFLKIDPSNVKTLYVHAIFQPLDEEGHQALPQENIKDTICAKLLTLLTLARNRGPLSSNWVKRSLKILKSKVAASSDLGIYVSAHAQYPGSPEKPMYADDYRKPEAFYCSQACLLGLRVKGQLDEECPNFSLHRQGNDTMKHRVNARQVTEMTRLQLSDDLDHNVSTLGLDFAYTVSYKITVNNYGYTFRAKGVVEGAYMSLGYEAGLYDMLQDEQGDTIPVHIGYFHLNKDEGFMFEGVAEIIGFLLVSNVGDMSNPVGRTQDLHGEAERLSGKLKAAGLREPPPQRLIVYDEPMQRYMYRDLTMIPGMVD